MLATHPATDTAIATGYRTIAKLIAATRRPKIRSHHLCCECGRFFHHATGQAHGPNLLAKSRIDGRTSHGICTPCFIRKIGRLPSRLVVVPLTREDVAGSDAPGGDLMAEAR
jgi:5-methylcytosine-specific restriction endonuclease McrA